MLYRTVCVHTRMCVQYVYTYIYIYNNDVCTVRPSTVVRRHNEPVNNGLFLRTHRVLNTLYIIVTYITVAPTDFVFIFYTLRVVRICVRRPRRVCTHRARTIYSYNTACVTIVFRFTDDGYFLKIKSIRLL